MRRTGSLGLLFKQFAGLFIPAYCSNINAMMRGVAIGAVCLIAALIRRIKNRFGTRKQRLVVCHLADLVPRMAHHAGRIDFRLGIHYLGRRDIVLVAAKGATANPSVIAATRTISRRPR